MRGDQGWRKELLQSLETREIMKAMDEKWQYMPTREPQSSSGRIILPRAWKCGLVVLQQSRMKPSSRWGLQRLALQNQADEMRLMADEYERRIMEIPVWQHPEDQGGHALT